MAEPRTEAQNRQRLDQLKPRYERLNSDRIRNEAEIERLEVELAAAEKEATEVFGTTDGDAIRAAIQDSRIKATEAVDAFENAIAEIETGLAAITQGKDA